MMDFEFSWKYKDFEIRTTNSFSTGEPYIELVKHETSESGRDYVFTLAYFHRSKDCCYELHFVGDRPLRYIADIDVSEIWRQLWLAQELFEDAEIKLRED